MTQDNKWFVSSQIKPEADVRIFLFPYAGGGPSVFSKWNAELPANVEVQIAHYPGRGSRYNETPFISLLAIVEELSQVIQPLIDKPFAFFGHSLGGSIAFELARRLRQYKFPQPNVLFISACNAPQILNLQPPIHTLSDDEFILSLKKLNGIPQEILQNDEMLKHLIPVLRADFELIETHKYTHDEPLNCPIVAFGGLDDERVSGEGLEGWAVQTSGRFESRYFPDDHFYINTARKSLIETINSEIASGRVSIRRKEQERGYSTTIPRNDS